MLYEGRHKNNENFLWRGKGWYFRLLPLGACTWLPSASVGQAASVRFFSWASVIVFVDFSMADLKEQRVCIKFWFLLEKPAAETVTMLREAFKEEALSQARVYEWFSPFKRGDISLEDQSRSGRPSTSRTEENILKIRNAIFDCRRTIDELKALIGVSWSSCQRILTEELHMKWIAAKFVPRLLSEDQRANRLDACREMKDQLKTDPDFLSKNITFFPVSKNEEGS